MFVVPTVFLTFQDSHSTQLVHKYTLFYIEKELKILFFSVKMLLSLHGLLNLIICKLIKQVLVYHLLIVYAYE